MRLQHRYVQVRGLALRLHDRHFACSLTGVAKTALLWRARRVKVEHPTRKIIFHPAIRVRPWLIAILHRWDRWSSECDGGYVMQ